MKEIERFPLTVPRHIESFLKLPNRIFTSSSLASLIMLAILPGQFIINIKNKAVKNAENGFCDFDSWYERNRSDRLAKKNTKTKEEELEKEQKIKEEAEDFRTTYEYINRKHQFKTSISNGIERLEAQQKVKGEKPQYELVCCGNYQDALNIFGVYSRIEEDPDKNFIFWNYPGVGRSKGDPRSVNDLFEAGYKEAKALLEEGIAPEDITLYGHSLGGAVALHIARRLHEEGYLVNVIVDRSFSILAQVGATIIKNSLFRESFYTITANKREDIDPSCLSKDRLTLIRLTKEHCFVCYGNPDGMGWKLMDCPDIPSNFLFIEEDRLISVRDLNPDELNIYRDVVSNYHKPLLSPYAPLISSLAMFSLSAISLTTVCAGVIASLGLICATAIASIGYIAAYFVRLVGLILKNIVEFIGIMISFPFSFISKTAADKIKVFFTAIAKIISLPFNVSSFYLNKIISTVATLVDSMINFLGNFVGDCLVVCGFIAGAILGFVWGGVLSIIGLWTTPIIMPTSKLLTIALDLTQCQIDSITNLKSLKSKAQIVNTTSDSIILPQDSLAYAVSTSPSDSFATSNHEIRWFKRGGHGEQLSEPVAMEEVKSKIEKKR